MVTLPHARCIPILIVIAIGLHLDQRLYAQAKLEYEVTLKEVTRKDQIWLRATLRNRGDRAVRVYWGDRAHPDMYRLKIVHVATGRRIPALGSSFSQPTALNRASVSKYFRTLRPGDQVEYSIVLSNFGGNAQHVIFREEGEYEITPSLHVITDQIVSEDSVSEEAEVAEDRTPIWTGTLSAKPIVITVPGTEPSNDSLPALQGKVVSFDGQPVAGATVQIRYSTEANFNWRNAKSWDNVFTTGDGTFEFAQVPEEADFSLTVLHPDHGRGYLVYELDSFLKKVPPVVRMPRMELFTGRVVDQNENDIAAVRVNHGGFTDHSGRFSIKVTRPDASDHLDVDLWKRNIVSAHKQLSWDEVTSGNAVLKVRTQQSLQVPGLALFADGTPVANCKIKFELLNYKEVQEAPGYRSQVSTSTDDDGKFTVTLPDEKLYRAKAITDEVGQDSGAGRRWQSEVPKLQVGQEPLNLVFDNRGTIVLRLFQLGKDRSNKITLSCSSLENGKNIAWERFDPTVTGHVYSGLEPGKYRITAQVENGGYGSWPVEVTVPDTEPFRALAVIKIPQVLTGSLTGRLIMPDGKTPASNFTIRSDDSTQVVTDSVGQFTIDSLPEGGTGLQVDPKDGLVLPSPSYASIKAGNETDLGKLQLVKESVEFGWFHGTLSHDDGREVHGYSLLGVVESYPYGRAGIPVFPINARGNSKTSTRSRRGNKLAVFDIFGSGRARNSVHGSMPFAESEVLQAVAVKLEIEGGKTIKRNVVVPKRSQGRSLKVSWPTDIRPHLTAVVPLDDDTHMIYELEAPKFVRYENGDPVPQDKSFKFSGISKGLGYLVATIGGKQGFFAILPFGEKQESIVLEPDEFASLDVSVADSKGIPIEDVTIQVATDLLGQNVQLGLPFTPPLDFLTPIQPTHPGGHLKISGLVPREYTVRLTHGEIHHTHPIELLAKTKHVLRFIIDEDGHISIAEP